MSPQTNRESIARFPTETRVHIALAVRDVARSRAFYEALFARPPAKVRDGYVKFEVLEPAVNLTLNQVAEVNRPDGVSHFGIQVKSTDAVAAARARVVGAGLLPRDEENVTCCFAVQDKFWVTDPDGHPWELFVVLADAAVHSEARAPAAEAGAKDAAAPCCAPGCCAS